MKKTLGIVLILLTCIFAACGTKTENEIPAEQPTQVAEQTPEEVTPEATATPEATPTPTEIPAMKDIMAQHNMKVGTCLSSYMLTNNNCKKTILKHFNSITFENEMKPDAILDQKESKKAGDIVVKFNKNTLEMLEWCKENGMSLRGHTLIWHSQTPTWIFYENFDNKGERASREVMLARMESYISQVFALLEELGYIEMFYAYDVVNEAWLDDGSMRPESLWYQTIGEEYLWYAFHFADKYAPDYIDLYYNDYNEQILDKPQALYNFVQTLKDDEGNYLIDGIGFQAHLYTEDSLEDYFATVELLGSLGLKINLTELDVSLGTWENIKPANEENLRAQGQFYYNLINGLFQYADEGKINMDALTFWGFNDNYSWRRDRSPLLFDSQYRPKYAYYGAAQIKELAGFEEE